MKTRLMFTTAVLAMLLAVPCAAAQQKAAQQVVPVDQLPAAVTASVAKSYPGSTIVSAAKMSRGKQVRYQLSVKASADAAPVALMVSPEGLISTTAKPAAGAAKPGAKGRKAAGTAAAAQPFPVVDLPKAVVKAIKDAYPKDTIIAALKSTSGSKVLYELTLTDVSSVAPLHVVVSEDGQIQKR
jgi:hypothetical protein